MKKSTSAIFVALIGAVAVIIAALIGWQGKGDHKQPVHQQAKVESAPDSPIYQAGRDIVIQQQTSTPKESPQHQLVQDTKRKTSQPSKKSADYAATGQQDKNKHPLLLYCTCKAEQTICYSTELKCQTISPDYGCIPKYSGIDAFNVFDKTRWNKYGDGWVYQKECVIEERRKQ
ncbi:MAG: hypothetical protein WC769_09435 [Thermodesulfovibrionales bacterium]|jgi:hypothetical protein